MSLDFPRPRLQLKAELRVPSLVPNRPLIGTAFDYLLRFHLRRRIPFATERPWVAERAHQQISRYGDAGALILAGADVIPSGEVRDRMRNVIRRAQRLVSAFLAGEPLSDSIIRSAINLAHCDTFYRVGRIDERFGKPLRGQVDELRRIVDVVDWSQFRAQRLCLLNPTFGEGSRLVGGADADLLLDDTLIDVKTTATLRIRTEDWRQLIAYAALNEGFPIGDGDAPVAIRRLGFYFSRHSYLASWPLGELVDLEKFSAFAAWLHDYLVKAEAERRARRKAFERERLERDRRRPRRTEDGRARRGPFREDAETKGAPQEKNPKTRPIATKRRPSR